MSPKLLMFVYFIFITGHLLCLTLEGAWLGDEDVDILESLVGYNTTELSMTGLMAIPHVLLGFFKTGIPTLITWDYSFLYGDFVLLRLTLLGAISVGVVWGVINAVIGFMQGLASKFF